MARPMHPSYGQHPAYLFAEAMETDGYAHASDGTLPRSAGEWPAWLVLALRPRFSLSIESRWWRAGVRAFRRGFARGLADRRPITVTAPLALTVDEVRAVRAAIREALAQESAR